MYSPCSFPYSLRWNWSISASSDSRDDAVYSLKTAASWGGRQEGKSTGTISSRAKNLGTKTSILASRGSPALIAWPTSWNLSNKGWKLRMRWMALNCLSSLTNTSDFSTLLRSATLTKLMLGATYLLSAKIAKK